ncbi:MAG: hypothetical protein R3B72_26395 [Polyangiaceae bacterium]
MNRVPHFPIDEALLARLPEPKSKGELEPVPARAKLAVTASAPEVLAACASLSEWNRRAEQLRIPTALVALAFLGLAVFGLVENRPPLLGVGLVGLALGIVGYVWLVGHDVNDLQLGVVVAVIRTFAPELQAGRPVVLTADFTDVTRAPGQGSGSVDVRRHVWLDLTLPLADGSSAELTAERRLKRKSRAKRKYTKLKDTLVDQLTIRLTPPKGKAFPESAKLRRPRVGGLRVARATVTPRHAVFVLQTHPFGRLFNRLGWQGQRGQLLTERQIIHATIQSHRSLAEAVRGSSRKS